MPKSTKRETKGGVARKTRVTKKEYASRNDALAQLSVLGLAEKKLLKVVEKIRDNQEIFDHPIGRKAISHATKHLFNQCRTTIKLRRATGPAYKWQCSNVGKTFNLLGVECAPFGKMLRRLHARSPSSYEKPWSLILYYDETVPGSPLRLDQVRKFMGVYASIKEFGPSALKHERNWIPAAVLRKNVIKTILGGWSGCLRQWLRHFLLAIGNCRDGIPMVSLDNALMFIKLGNFLADEGGHTAGYYTKGATAIMPCLDCYNVCGVGRLSILRPDDAVLVDLSCTDTSRFLQRTTADVWRIYDKLKAMQANPMVRTWVFKQEQIKYGLKYNPYALFADEDLREFIFIEEQTVHDPTHTMYADGQANTELNMFLRKLVPAGLTFQHLHDYIASGWTQPRAVKTAGSITSMFSQLRADHFKRAKPKRVAAFASEMLAVFPLLAHLFQVRDSIRKAFPLEVDSFAKLGVVCRAMAMAKQGIDNADHLNTVTYEHGEAFIATYDRKGIKSKFHNLRKMARQLKRDGFLMDTFALERMHAMLKEAATPVRNTRDFEESVT